MKNCKINKFLQWKKCLWWQINNNFYMFLAKCSEQDYNADFIQLQIVGNENVGNDFIIFIFF